MIIVIGKVIRKMRKSKKINQQKLGTMIGVAQTGYETGYSNPEFSLIKNIADICNYAIIFVERDTKEEITL